MGPSEKLAMEFKPIVRRDVPPVVKQCLIAVKPQASLGVTEKNCEALKMGRGFREFSNRPNLDDPTVGVAAAGLNNTRQPSSTQPRAGFGERRTTFYSPHTTCTGAGSTPSSQEQDG